MADLFILLPVHDGDEALFAWRSAGDWTVDTAAPAGRSGRGEQTVAFVPGTAVTVHQADVAARKPAEAQRLALFALEDELAQPVEQVHVALGPAGETAKRDILVASRDDMDRWTAWLRQAGHPDADLVAPQSCLPPEPCAAEGPDEYLFRTGATAFALDADVPGDLLQTLAPEGLETVYGENLDRTLGVEAAGPASASRADWLARLAGWYRDGLSGGPVSLRQGDYAVRRAMKLEGLSQWRLAGALAAAAVMLWLGSVWLETGALQDQTVELRTQTDELAAAAVPDAGDLSAAREELRQSQARGMNRLRPTEASAALYEAISPVRNAEIRSLRFDGASGRLTALVIFDNYSEADAIGQRLEERGLAVSLGEARQSGSRVMGEFVIEAGT